MGGRSGSADLRCAAVAAYIAIAAAACTATSPPPLPARRVDFPAPAPDGASDEGSEVETLARPPELPATAEAPIRHERYFWWTLTADAGSLLYWFADPTDIYHAAPMLLLTPLIHTAHGELRSAAISLGMRLALYGTLYYADRLADRECGGSSRGYVCFPLGTFVLVEAVLSTVVVVDAVILARRDVPAQEWHRLPLVGAVADAEGRRMLTLSGRF